MATTREASIEELIARRRPQPAETLAPETVRWLAGLPGDVRPRQLPIEYVRIANALGRAWADPQACLRYFDELLIDRRGNRRGFSFNVALELAGLKDHYETVVHPTEQTVWDLIVAHHY